LEDGDNSQPLILHKEKIKIGDRKFERIRDDILDRLPSSLFDIIKDHIDIATSLTQEEIDAINFTQPSPTPNSNAETAKAMPPDASTTSRNTECNSMESEAIASDSTNAPGA